ncbi:hypothetical protein MVEN_00021700 [Mycena venus]|uniref:Uncharacterized protein n=1 Tax=Mycena venus TaxID=2733690 RepID=A0A8H6Z6U1_9AGAR|nr:hypothetical protein MVEN_00021700 [Mycena venus]
MVSFTAVAEFNSLNLFDKQLVKDFRYLCNHMLWYYHSVEFNQFQSPLIARVARAKRRCILYYDRVRVDEDTAINTATSLLSSPPPDAGSRGNTTRTTGAPASAPVPLPVGVSMFVAQHLTAPVLVSFGRG